MHKAFAPIIFLGLIVLGAAIYMSPGSDSQAPIHQEESIETKTYSSSVYGLSFAYSPTLYLKERVSGALERPQLSIVLVEDTPENREVIEGRSSVAREGPPAITIDVYPNPDQLHAEDWVRADTNWTVRTTDAAPFGAGSVTGVTYSWSGLYEGKSVVVTEGARTYVFSVTWMTPEEPVLTEFDRILETVRIGS